MERACFKSVSSIGFKGLRYFANTVIRKDFFMNITVIGCGRWGSFIAWYLDRTGHTVALYGRKGSSHMQQFMTTRSNGLLTLPESITLTNTLDDLDKSDVIVISIAAQSLDSLMTQLEAMQLRNKVFVLCMKGIEIGTGRRLSQIAGAHLDASNKIAVWIGPGHRVNSSLKKWMVAGAFSKESTATFSVK